MDNDIRQNDPVRCGRLTLTGHIVRSFADTITAFATGGQAGAVPLTKGANRISTVATAGDSVALPKAPQVPGEAMEVLVINDGANPAQVFADPGCVDTVNGQLGSVGISVPPSSITLFSSGQGSWRGKVITVETTTALNTVGAGTITAAGIVSGNTVRGGAQTSTPFTDTTDTAVNIIAGSPNPGTGQTFEWVYQNRTNAVATLAGGAGVTVTEGTGALTVGNGMAARFLVKQTAATTVSITLLDACPVDAMPAFVRNSISSGNGTLTGANMAGGKVTTLLTSGATALTTATAANILAAMAGADLGTTYRLRIVNTNGGTLTITADASVTLTGTATLVTNSWREWDVTILTATTASMAQVGTGTTN